MDKTDLIPVGGHENLARDPKSGAILNINKHEIENARVQKKIRKQRLEEQEKLKETVDQLQNEMKEIKGLLSQIAEKL